MGRGDDEKDGERVEVEGTEEGGGIGVVAIKEEGSGNCQRGRIDSLKVMQTFHEYKLEVL